MGKAEEPLPATPTNRTILVVNDSQDFLAFMREFLSLEGGYEVATLDQSEGIIEHARALPPDMIILDLVFQGRASGLEAAETLAATAETAHVPVLFCTALSERQIPAEARDLATSRGHRILYKPFDVDELLQHVDEMLGVERRELGVRD